MFAAAPLLAAAGSCAFAKTSVIAHLIQEAPADGGLSQRIDFISRALLGVRYQADTLIGGPRRQELFVVRADAFDCITYCEVVLAAAIAKDIGEFEAVLRCIRYEHGEVRWDQRNHDFAKWSQRIVENKICQPVRMNPSVSIEKTLNGGGLGKRWFSIIGIAPSTLLANHQLLRGGDVIGFVSRQSNLDFFHAGFTAFGKNAGLLLRHASQSYGRVLDEKMETFLAANGVKYVTLLRAENPAPASS